MHSALLKVWVSRPSERDSIDVRVVRYEQDGDGYLSGYLGVDGEWHIYGPAEVVPAVLVLPGHRITTDPEVQLVEDISAQVTERLRAVLPAALFLA